MNTYTITLYTITYDDDGDQAMILGQVFAVRAETPEVAATLVANALPREHVIPLRSWHEFISPDDPLTDIRSHPALLLDPDTRAEIKAEPDADATWADAKKIDTANRALIKSLTSGTPPAQN